MAKKVTTEGIAVVLQNVTLDEPQTFDFDWAERILITQSRYFGFQPYALPTDSEYAFVDGKLIKK